MSKTTVSTPFDRLVYALDLGAVEVDRIKVLCDDSVVLACARHAGDMIAEALRMAREVKADYYRARDEAEAARWLPSQDAEFGPCGEARP